MNGNCHFIYAASVNGMIALNLDKINMILPNIPYDDSMRALIIMGGLIGGIFPDIDNPKSSFGQLSKPVSTIIGKIGSAFGKKGANHRGIFHDFSIYLAGLILSYYFAPFLIGFMIGALTHLFLDAFTPAGVPFIFGTFQIHLGKVTSGSKGAIVLTYILMVMSVGLGLTINYYIH